MQMSDRAGDGLKIIGREARGDVGVIQRRRIDHLEHQLDQLLKRKLAAVACSINGCAYCTAHSCSMLKKPKELGFEGWGVSEEELQDIITGAYVPANEMERACFDYVRAASEDPTSVPDEILQRCKQHLTPAQTVELACVVGFWKFYNAVHDSLHIPVESSLLGDTGYVDL